MITTYFFNDVLLWAMFITLMQYSQFVKPAFDDFILPTKKYADIIIPRGGDNHIAVDLIVQHIRTKLGQHDLCKIYPNLYVIQSTFQVSLPKNCHSSSKFCFVCLVVFFFWITIHCLWSRADTGYAYPHTWFSNNKAWFCFLFWPINSFGAYLVLWAKRLIWYCIFEVSSRMGPLFICLITHQESLFWPGCWAWPGTPAFYWKAGYHSNWYVYTHLDILT